MQFCEFVITLSVFKDRFCGWRWRWWSRVVEGLYRLVFGVVRRRGHLRGESVQGHKAVLRQSSDVIRHHIPTLFDQGCVSVQIAADRVVPELRELWPRWGRPFVVRLKREHLYIGQSSTCPHGVDFLAPQSVISPPAARPTTREPFCPDRCPDIQGFRPHPRHLFHRERPREQQLALRER